MLYSDNAASEHKQDLFFTGLHSYQNRQMNKHLLSSYSFNCMAFLLTYVTNHVLLRNTCARQWLFIVLVVERPSLGYCFRCASFSNIFSSTRSDSKKMCFFVILISILDCCKIHCHLNYTSFHKTVCLHARNVHLI